MKISNSWVHNGYRVLKIDGVQKRNSHYIWFQNTGYWPQYDNDEIIHHINFDSLDDRFENLQLMTNSEHASFHDRIQFEMHNFTMLGKFHTEEWKREHSERMTGENHPMYGKSRPEVSERMKLWHKTHDVSGENNPMFGKTGESCPSFGRTGSSSSRWIIGPVSYITYYMRVRAAKKRIAAGRGTEEDLQLVQGENSDE